MEENAAMLSAKILKHRHTGTQGTPILMHRSIRRIKLSSSAIFAIILLPIFFDVMLWINLEFITSLWADIFDFFMQKLNFDGQVLFVKTQLLGKNIFIPYPDLPTSIPSKIAIYSNIVFSLFFLAIVQFIPKNYLPATYLLRAALLIQLSASLYYIVHPSGNPYELSGYISGMLTVGIYVLIFTPPLLALIYYIFDFPFWQKFMASLLIIGYFLLATPLQYMLHAIIISSLGMLFMPVLYLLFGVLLNTLMFVSLYAWVMTWKTQ